MTPYEEARRLVLDGVVALPPVRLPVVDALGLVAAEEVVAVEQVPPFDNTAMDGFAVRASDTPGRLRVVGFLPAGGTAGVPVGPGEAVRIMTGAPMPNGADAVVMVERTTVEGDEVVVEEVPPGEAVRRAGSDVRPGDVVVGLGTALTPGHLGVLVSVGAVDVAVHPRPRVGVLSTGDELRGPGEPLGEGQIRDSNRPTLLSLVRENGFEPVDLGTVADDADAVEAAIRAGVERCDGVLTSGGVSMGDLDHVKAVLTRIGDPARWLQVAIKPAKPLSHAVVDGTPVLGLPGNPVSSMVSFELFARPVLRRLAGHPHDRLFRPPVAGVAGEALRRRSDGKVHFVRVAVEVDNGRLVARSAGGQGSHHLAAMAAADALAVLHDGDGVDLGEEIALLLLR